MAQMPMRIAVIWISALVIYESCHAQKMTIHWGPQSTMYLKGKHGRRYLSDDGDGVFKQGPKVKGYPRLHEFKASQPSQILSSENIFIQYLQNTLYRA